jgi:hypothetical protein
LIEQGAAEDVLIDALAELHDFLELFGRDVEFLWVCLRHQKHLVVLLPVSHEVGVFLDDQVHDVESREYLTKVVKNLVINHLFKTVGVYLVF